MRATQFRQWATQVLREFAIKGYVPDKSLEMTLQVAGLDEIKQWVMGLGPAAEVIEPEGLKELIRQDLKKTLSKYEKTTYETSPSLKNEMSYLKTNRMKRRF